MFVFYGRAYNIARNTTENDICMFKVKFSKVEKLDETIVHIRHNLVYISEHFNALLYRYNIYTTFNFSYIL